MKYEEYLDKVKILKKESLRKNILLLKEYCDSNNPYKIGDIFTDNLGSILIDEIKYANEFSGQLPCCVYFGYELTKKKEVNKKKIKREAWQCNDINIYKGLTK